MATAMRTPHGGREAEAEDPRRCQAGVSLFSASGNPVRSASRSPAAVFD
jgi:hypothetical protein